jgi:hypothetical protein
MIARKKKVTCNHRPKYFSTFYSRDSVEVEVGEDFWTSVTILDFPLLSLLSTGVIRASG